MAPVSSAWACHATCPGILIDFFLKKENRYVLSCHERSTLVPAYTHARAHTHARTHACTHTHTHRRLLVLSLSHTNMQAACNSRGFCARVPFAHAFTAPGPRLVINPKCLFQCLQTCSACLKGLMFTGPTRPVSFDMSSLSPTPSLSPSLSLKSIVGHLLWSPYPDTGCSWTQEPCRLRMRQ